MDALELLSGDAQSFLEKVWASRVHVHHTDPARLTGLLSVDDVDHLLTGTGLRTPALRVARDGKVLPASQFTRAATLAGSPLTGLVDGRKVLRLFDAGASLVLQGLHRYWAPLAELVRDLERSLGHPCQANAYLTPPGSQGFAVHSDTHDVFVFQTHGTKLWEVHEEGVQQVLMQPGTSMYLPTGTPHAARAQDTASLHVTIGINQLTWRTQLRRMVNDLLDHERYDERLPAGYLDDPTGLARQLADQLSGLRDQLSEQDPDRLAGEQVRRFLTGRTPWLRGALTDRLHLESLDERTPLHRRPGATCVLVAAGDRLRVLLGDRELDMPARLAAPMRTVAQSPRLTPADLHAWLDPESSLVLVRRLVREGLLQVTE